MRRHLRAAWIGTLSVAALVGASTVTNLSLAALEAAGTQPYGTRLQVEGGQLNVSVAGDADQTVVLLGGYGTASPVLDFTPLTHALEDTFTVVVIERFGYGYSDLDVTDRTVKNVSIELHAALTELSVDDYVLVAHSMGAIYSMDYVNRFPGEVSALVTLDGTVPADYAVPPPTRSWDRLLSLTGWVRWVTALDPSTTAPSAPTGVYPQHVLDEIRLMTVRNYANPAMADENLRSAENFAAVSGQTYPPDLPVLAFLSQQTIDRNSDWRADHEKQLEAADRSDLVLLDGGHYLHWTHAPEIAASIDAFTDSGDP